MEKKKKEIIFIIILIPVMGYFVYNNLISPRKEVPAAAAEKELKAPAEKELKAPEKKIPAVVENGTKKGDALAAFDEKLAQIQENISRQPWGRDPFNPAPTPVEEASRASDCKDFKLTGVAPSPEGGAAIINGEVIGLGETYRGYRLVRIESSQIILEKDGHSYILNMPEE